MFTDTMQEIFVKCPWYSIFITAKYEYATQNSFLQKQSLLSPRSTLQQIAQFIF